MIQRLLSIILIFLIGIQSFSTFSHALAPQSEATVIDNWDMNALILPNTLENSTENTDDIIVDILTQENKIAVEDAVMPLPKPKFSWIAFKASFKWKYIAPIVICIVSSILLIVFATIGKPELIIGTAVCSGIAVLVTIGILVWLWYKSQAVSHHQAPLSDLVSALVSTHESRDIWKNMEITDISQLLDSVVIPDETKFFWKQQLILLSRYQMPLSGSVREPISNALDAQAGAQRPIAQITTNSVEGSMHISDPGKGMSLYDILFHLLTPGYSENQEALFDGSKGKKDVIGHFGQGFWASLYWLKTEGDCISVFSQHNDPDSPTYQVDIFIQNNQYHYAIRKSDVPRSFSGTSVVIRSQALRDPDTMRHVLEDGVLKAFRYNSRADIIVNDTPIPNPSQLRLQKLPEANFGNASAGEDKKIKYAPAPEKATILFGGESVNEKGHVAITSKGVTIVTIEVKGPNIYRDVAIDFPNLELTPERNQFNFTSPKNKEIMRDVIDNVLEKAAHPDRLLNTLHPLMSEGKCNLTYYIREKLQRHKVIPCLDGMAFIHDPDALRVHTDYLDFIPKFPGKRVYSTDKLALYAVKFKTNSPKQMLVHNINGQITAFMDERLLHPENSDRGRHCLFGLQKYSELESDQTLHLTSYQHVYNTLYSPSMEMDTAGTGDFFIPKGEEQPVQKYYNYLMDQGKNQMANMFASFIKANRFGRKLCNPSNNDFRIQEKDFDWELPQILRNLVTTFHNYIPGYEALDNENKDCFFPMINSLSTAGGRLPEHLPSLLSYGQECRKFQFVMDNISAFAEMNFLGDLEPKEKEWIFMLSSSSQKLKLSEHTLKEFIDILRKNKQFLPNISLENLGFIYNQVEFFRRLDFILKGNYLPKNTNLMIETRRMNLREVFEKDIKNQLEKNTLKNISQDDTALLSIHSRGSINTEELFKDIEQKFESEFALVLAACTFFGGEIGRLDILRTENPEIPPIPLEDFLGLEKYIPSRLLRQRTIRKAIKQNPDPGSCMGELAKNASEAGATEVEVKTWKSEQGNFIVTFEDNGKGMSEKDIPCFLMPGISGKTHSKALTVYDELNNFGHGFMSVFAEGAFNRAVVTSRAVDTDTVLEITLQKTDDGNGLEVACTTRKATEYDMAHGTHITLHTNREATFVESANTFFYLRKAASQIDPDKTSVRFGDRPINPRSQIKTPFYTDAHSGITTYVETMPRVYYNKARMAGADIREYSQVLPDSLKAILKTLGKSISVDFPKGKGILQTIGRSGIADDGSIKPKAQKAYLIAAVKLIAEAFQEGTLSARNIPMLPYDYFYKYNVFISYKRDRLPKNANKNLMNDLMAAAQNGLGRLDAYSVEDIVTALNDPTLFNWIFINASRLPGCKQDIRQFLRQNNYVDNYGKYVSNKETETNVLIENFKAYARQNFKEYPDPVLEAFFSVTSKHICKKKIDSETYDQNKVCDYFDEYNIPTQFEEDREILTALRGMLTFALEKWLKHKTIVNKTPNIQFVYNLDLFAAKAYSNHNRIEINMASSYYTRFKDAWKTKDIKAIEAWMTNFIFVALAHELRHMEEGQDHTHSTHDEQFRKRQGHIQMGFLFATNEAYQEYSDMLREFTAPMSNNTNIINNDLASIRTTDTSA